MICDDCRRSTVGTCVVHRTVRRYPASPDEMTLSVDVSVPIPEMREWRPERISRYFAGIAMALAAIEDEPEDAALRAHREARP